MQLQTASVSEVGGRSRNEDAYGEWRHGTLYASVVADGAGGHGGGDTASRIAVDTVIAELTRVAATGVALTGLNLLRVLLRANDAIIDAQEHDRELSQMRSTAALLGIDQAAGVAAWAHCGDTRLYCFRRGATVVQTQDHSLVQSMIDARLLDMQDVRGHPRRNVLFSALGTAEDLSIAASEEAFFVADGDAFLLCTDGFWEYLDEAVMIEAIGRARTPAAWLEAMVGHIRDAARDNFTALAVWVLDSPETTVVR
ncbi:MULTISPECIES: protein phosphatase 2C domain-containing protein [unclassified Caballeronia]|uniref:PP2C family protein-serine/threonine phosphatase n=1 Tax=unclassified Caballeronia TaxID=2646786 RepID=UPI0028572846|nr:MULTISPECIES: protein phosphatase 2C domain-containing protein [unclassified Caballeronia]MDR5740975.1 protein phosphatase 2C domain-containing protein [Caballeronia sp. LZ016]MDR5806873.1 protein phosphatase 2C domain-containing protein [Caballeronia sp. LZ019]